MWRAIADFYEAHTDLVWTIVAALVGYLNVAPRPHPDRHDGWRYFFWLAVDRICVLTAEQVPGRFKWLLKPSPSPIPPESRPRLHRRASDPSAAPAPPMPATVVVKDDAPSGAAPKE